jgi:RHS repeat-associated protein
VTPSPRAPTPPTPARPPVPPRAASPGPAGLSHRELVYALNTADRITTVFDANSSLAATLAYSTSSCTWTASQVQTLCTVTDNSGSSRPLTFNYAYTSTNPSAVYDYDLNSLTPPGSSSSIGDIYLSSGQVSSQTDLSGAATTYTYAWGNSSYLGGSTTITNPPGTGGISNTTTDFYSNNVLIAQTVAAASSATSSVAYQTDPVSLQPLSSIDANGNVTNYEYQSYNQTNAGSPGNPTSSNNRIVSIDGVGNSSENAYNTNNQAWCSVDAADYANAKRCPASPPSAPPSPGTSDPNLGMTINFYNTSDQLTATTDALGDTTTYSYTSSGLMYCSVDPVDYQKSVTCPGYGLAHVTGTTASTFDPNGDKTSSTDADGNTTTYTYGVAGLPGAVATETDPDGTTTTYTYNPAGQVTSQVASFGTYSATTINSYDGQGRQYCTVSPQEYANAIRCPSSPPSSPPTPTSDPYLGATITSYNADNQVIQITNPLGGITYNAYDPAGNRYCTVAPAEAAASVTCPSSEPTTPPAVGSSDAYLGATITTYNADNQVIQTTNPLGGITLTSYTPNNQVAQTTDESGASAAPNVVTAYSYDGDNRTVATTVDAGSSLAQTTLQAYDPNGNVYCSVSANAAANGSSTFQCPPWQAAWIATPPNPSALYSTTPTSAQANNVTTTFYNTNGQQAQTTNPDVDTSITAIDGDGRTYCTSDPTNVIAWLAAHPSGSYPYNCPNAPPSTPPAAGSNPGYVTTIYDYAGRTTSTTDQAGDTTTYTYTPGGQKQTVTDPRGEVTTNCYYYQNGTGQCAHSAPGGAGSADDLYSTTTPATSADPSGETTTTTYYPGGKTDTVTTPAGTTTDSYDNNGDLTAVTYSGTATGYSTPTNLSTTYNVDGTRHTVTDATGTTTYGYDANGDVTSQSLTAIGGLSNKAVSYTYVPSGVVASTVYPSYTGHTNPTVTYTYDGTGTMASETDWLGNQVTFGHDADGNTTSQDNNVSSSYPNGTSSTTFSYDNADNNTQATSTLAQTCGGNETLTQAFSGTGGSRNPDSQVTQDSETYTGSCSGQTNYQRNYTYDIAGRLVYQGSSSQGANPNNLAYDYSGDPTTISNHDTSGNFDTYTQTFDNAGEVTGQTPISGSHGVTTTYTYDTLGDQTKAVAGSNTTTYSYNQIGQMVGATTPTTTATYAYNSDGLSAATTTSSSTTQFTWNTNDSLALILTDGANDYIYGPTDEPVEQIALATSAPTYLTYICSESSWLSTNSAGDQTGFWRSDAYGNVVPASSVLTASSSPFGYSGQYTDTTTGFLNDRARWYEPEVGGFTTRDPAFDRTGVAYGYANGDPISNIDPSGNQWLGTNCWNFYRNTSGRLGQICILINRNDWNGLFQALARFNSINSGKMAYVAALRVYLNEDFVTVSSVGFEIRPPNNGTNGYISTHWVWPDEYAAYQAYVVQPEIFWPDGSVSALLGSYRSKWVVTA